MVRPCNYREPIANRELIVDSTGSARLVSKTLKLSKIRIGPRLKVASSISALVRQPSQTRIESRETDAGRRIIVWTELQSIIAKEPSRLAIVALRSPEQRFNRQTDGRPTQTPLEHYGSELGSRVFQCRTAHRG
jgi:hypothetical protein